MKLSLKERKLLDVFACPNHHNTVTRLKLLTVLAVDPEANHRTLELVRKVATDIGENWHRAFYLHLRREMDEYYAAKRRLRLVKNTTEYEEDLYGEVI